MAVIVTDQKSDNNSHKLLNVDHHARTQSDLPTAMACHAWGLVP